MRNTSPIQSIKSNFFTGLARVSRKALACGFYRYYPQASALRLTICALTLILSLTSTTLAQENGELGRMWTFENPPLAYLEQEYGFKPDQEWLDALRFGSLRLGGEDIQSGFGSASFVSPNGLIMTSTRCVRDAVAWTRPKDLTIINTGFVAAGPEDEVRLRSRLDGWLSAAQLIKITDVTDEVNKGFAPTDNETQIKEKREANKKTILEVARKVDPKLVPHIVSLYQGAVVQLYQYKVYDDIRLVVLPHIQTAHFGGDADNFTYPRHNLDFAFLRAYEDGKPADTTKHYFKWKPGGAKEDELVFVSGNPDTTKRLFTKAQLEFERDFKIPMKIEWLTDRLRFWKTPPFDPENPSRHWAWVRSSILEWENGLKAARGNLNGLNDAKLMAQKTAAEQAFKRRVMTDENLAKQYGDLWDRIDSMVQERRLHEARERFHTSGGEGFVNMAITIVRSLDPAETVEARNGAREEMKGWPGGGGLPNAFGRAFVVSHFDRARNWLAKDDPYFSKVLGGRSGKEFLEAVIGPGNAGHRGGPQVRTLVHYPEQREALFESGWKGIQECEDPAIVAARELVPLMRMNKKISEELNVKEEALGIEIGRALLACYGTEFGPNGVSSDGTNTLRFTDGVVQGFPSGGKFAPHRTTFDGLYGRGRAFNNKYPFNLPQIWLDREDKIDMTKSINFVSTNDISGDHMLFESLGGLQRWRGAGGNFGSVVVNKELEVVGVVVDKNLESLHNDFVFRDDVPRAVSAHVDGIMEALVKIYDAHHIVEELTGE